MKNTLRTMLAALMLALCLAGCGDKKLDGRYMAVNPPVESGESVTMELEFSGSEVTMISGSLSQKVTYEIKDGKFILETSFGDFSYDFAEKENGFTLDGIDYEKQ